MDYKKIYRLSDDITEKKIKKYGFKNGMFKTYLYKNLVMLKIIITTDDNNEYYWYYQVVNNDSTLYVHYYNNSKNNTVVDKVKERMEDEFKKLKENGIFTKI